jgi:hypothetical protein
MAMRIPVALAGLLLALVVLGACLTLPGPLPETGSPTVLPGGEVILPSPDTTGGSRHGGGGGLPVPDARRLPGLNGCGEPEEGSPARAHRVTMRVEY